MKTIIVWYLITVGGYNNNQLVYSPPMATKEDCVFVQKQISNVYQYYESRCVGIKQFVKE